MINEKTYLEHILSELGKGNINVLDIDVKQKLGMYAATYAQMNPQAFNPVQQDALKTLIMICNIIYNRTDMQVMPVEDGIYDMLMEIYKKIDPNFQVGSTVIDFKDQVDKSIMLGEIQKKVQPLYFYDNTKDDIRYGFEYDLLKFDRNRINYQEMHYYKSQFDDPFDQSIETISKRTHDTKHNHPQLVGTLDKCKYVLISDAYEKSNNNVLPQNVSILERDFFHKHIQMGLITQHDKLEVILELKYDGISVEADCTDEIISARTRGDTGMGVASDITPILKGYKFLRNDVLKDRVVGVKFEAIMTKDNLEKFNKERGYNYSNCRTAIIGLFGSADAYKYQKYITLIPLAIDRDDVPEVHNRIEEIELMNRLYKNHGEPLRYVTISGNLDVILYMTKKFVEEANFAKHYLGFAFDGVVVSYLDEDIRSFLGRENFINKYSIAVKFDPLEKLTTFLGYTYEVGMTGAITPMIHYSPVEFNGTIHDKSTGSSLSRFNDLNLAPGDVISVTYNNDVMPYVSKPMNEHNANNPAPKCKFPDVCPICGSKLVISESGKSASCPNIYCAGRAIARSVNMMRKLNIKGFAESLIGSMKIYSFTDLINVVKDKDKLSDTIGSGNADNLIEAVNKLITTPTEDYKLMSSLGFTSIGVQKWKIILKVYSIPEFVKAMSIDQDLIYDEITHIKGMSDQTARTVMEEYPRYKRDIETILSTCNIIETKSTKTLKEIRFSGCRNPELEQQLCAMGNDANSNASVTKKTDILIIPYEGYSSTKVNKAQSNGTTIIVTMADFTNDMSKYL